MMEKAMIGTPLRMTVSAGTGAMPPGHIAQALVEIEPEIVVLQGFTLDRVGDLVGRLEKATRLQAIDVSLFACGHRGATAT